MKKIVWGGGGHIKKQEYVLICVCFWFIFQFNKNISKHQELYSIALSKYKDLKIAWQQNCLLSKHKITGKIRTKYSARMHKH